MRQLIAILVLLASISSQAVILLPGKIENPLRADKILTEKFNMKKKAMARYRQALKVKYAAKKKAQASKLTAMATAPTSQEQQLQSKGMPSDGSQIRDPLKSLQEVKETNH